MSSSGGHRPKDGADIIECVNQSKTYSKNQGAINEGGREVAHLGWGQAGWKDHAPQSRGMPCLSCVCLLHRLSPLTVIPWLQGAELRIEKGPQTEVPGVSDTCLLYQRHER